MKSLTNSPQRRRDAEENPKKGSLNHELHAMNSLRSLPPLRSLTLPFLVASSASLRLCGVIFLLAATLSAAITGTVINKTTGKPQAGATVALNKLGQQLGIEMIDQAKSGPDGSFTINQDIAGPTPYLIRTAFDGVTYNHMLPPGSQTAGLTIEVYNASKQPGQAKVTKHMLLFQPSGGQMTINETYLFENDGQTAWNDPGAGTLHFFLPVSAEGKVTAEVTAPGGMPIGAPTAKTAKPDIYEIDYPVKPGETRFDLTYSGALHRRRALRWQNCHQRREHLPDRAQRRDHRRRGPQRPWTGTQNPGASLRILRQRVPCPTDRRRGSRLRPRRRGARKRRPADRADHAAPLRQDRSPSWPWRSVFWRSASRCSIALTGPPQPKESNERGRG